MKFRGLPKILSPEFNLILTLTSTLNKSGIEFYRFLQKKACRRKNLMHDLNIWSFYQKRFSIRWIFNDVQMKIILILCNGVSLLWLALQQYFYISNKWTSGPIIYVYKIANRAHVKHVYSVGEHFSYFFRKFIVAVLTKLCPFIRKNVPNNAAQTKIQDEIIKQSRPVILSPEYLHLVLIALFLSGAQ
jgi:hypothetical protein